MMNDANAVVGQASGVTASGMRVSGDDRVPI